MACGFADKCPHYNAWWCDINHSSCGVGKKLEASEPAPAPDTPVSGASEPAEKAKNRKNRKRGGE